MPKKRFRDSESLVELPKIPRAQKSFREGFISRKSLGGLLRLKRCSIPRSSRQVFYVNKSFINLMRSRQA